MDSKDSVSALSEGRRLGDRPMAPLRVELLPATPERLGLVAEGDQLTRLTDVPGQDPAPRAEVRAVGTRLRHRLRSLDVLRAIAVLLVLGHHMAPPNPDVALPVRAVAVAWHRAGWVGVDLFFVLSGFLVSGLLFTEWQRYGRM